MNKRQRKNPSNSDWTKYSVSIPITLSIKEKNELKRIGSEEFLKRRCFGFFQRVAMFNPLVDLDIKAYRKARSKVYRER